MNNEPVILGNKIPFDDGDSMKTTLGKLKIVFGMCYSIIFKMLHI